MRAAQLGQEDWSFVDVLHEAGHALREDKTMRVIQKRKQLRQMPTAKGSCRGSREREMKLKSK